MPATKAQNRGVNWRAVTAARAWRGILLLGLLAAGCVSTPARRIERNAELFKTLPPEVQANLRQGRIEVGYTKDMVYLALGGPQRVFARKTATAETTIWSYSRAAYSSDMQPIPATTWYRDRHGRLHPAFDWVWVDAGRASEYEAMRVEFAGDKAIAIETLNPRP
jgi:hypothetical protein